MHHTTPLSLHGTAQDGQPPYTAIARSPSAAARRQSSYVASESSRSRPCSELKRGEATANKPTSCSHFAPGLGSVPF